jgi:hypothetical protein
MNLNKNCKWYENIINLLFIFKCFFYNLYKNIGTILKIEIKYVKKEIA